MVDINNALVSDDEDDKKLGEELDEKGFSADLDEVTSDFITKYKETVVSDIVDSAQASQDESKKKGKIEKVGPKPGSVIPGSESIDYMFFNLPDDSEKYIEYVNRKNISVRNTTEQLKDDGTLILHVFSTKREIQK